MLARSRTSAELITLSLQMLNIIPADAEADGVEAATARLRYEEIYASGLDDGLIDWPADEVPLPVFRAMAQLVADAVSPTFGHAPNGNPDDYDRHPGWQRLRRYRQEETGKGQVLEIEEF